MLTRSRCLPPRSWRSSGRGFHTSRRLTDRSYGDAVAALNSLQSNFAAVDAIRKSGRGMNQEAIPEMVEWLRKIGYTPHDFDSINAIHIAGTKGKGSTAAFVSSILSEYLPQDGRKVGLYTSPHLRFVRERIQINNQPISEDSFAKTFFEVWARLETAQEDAGENILRKPKPLYFRYLTLMAFHAYLEEKVGAAVIECGIGGEYDSTNILQSPMVTGITSLGIDHTAMLGSTIEEIAWHKAGIMKRGTPAFTALQPAGALAVLESRAVAKGVDLKVVPVHPQIDSGSAVLGLQGEFQKINASLAVELAGSSLRRLGFGSISTETLPVEFLQGLRKVRWAGRCETRNERDLIWHIDGGHTLESIQVVGKWFEETALLQDTVFAQSESSDLPPRILLFNQQTRAGFPLLQELLKITTGALSNEPPFTHAIFCSNVTFSNAGYKADLVSINVSEIDVRDLTVQKELAAKWQSLQSDAARRATSHVVPTIEGAVDLCRKIAEQWKSEYRSSALKPRVLATGSLHLVGGLLEVLETQKPHYIV